ncbi:hypothetical protein L9F63_014269, partial [Diploptera punctata]
HISSIFQFFALDRYHGGLANSVFSTFFKHVLIRHIAPELEVVYHKVYNIILLT